MQERARAIEIARKRIEDIVASECLKLDKMDEMDESVKHAYDTFYQMGLISGLKSAVIELVRMETEETING